MNPTIERAAQLSESAREIFNLLCWLERRFKLAFPSQRYIAKKIGISRVHCNRLIGELVDAGFIDRLTRPWHSSLYRIHPSLWHEVTRKKFYPFFKSLKWICLVLLMSPFPGYVTHILKRRELLVNNNSLSFYNSTNISYIRLSKKGRSLLNNNILIHGMTESPWPSHLSNIKSLNLSKWGQIRLSIYPVAAIEHAESREEHVKMAREPFKYFETLCNKYCTDNGLELDFSTLYLLQERFGVPKSDVRMTLDEPKRIVIKEEDPYKRADAYQERRYNRSVAAKVKPYVNTRGNATPHYILQKAKERIKARQENYAPSILEIARSYREKIGIREDGTLVNPLDTNQEIMKRLFCVLKGPV